MNVKLEAEGATIKISEEELKALLHSEELLLQTDFCGAELRFLIVPQRGEDNPEVAVGKDNEVTEYRLNLPMDTIGALENIGRNRDGLSVGDGLGGYITLQVDIRKDTRKAAI